MAVFSMTGFASVQGAQAGDPPVSGPGVHAGLTGLGIELRSVNSRFLDLAFRLPDELRSNEPLLRERLQKAFKRGKIEVRIWHESSTTQSLPTWEPGSAMQLMALQNNLQQSFPNAQPFRSIDLLRLAEKASPLNIHPTEQVLALADVGIAALSRARATEGKRLAIMLLGHCTQLRALADTAQPLAKTAVTQHQTRFLQRWQDAIALGENTIGESLNTQAKTDRALAEAASFAIRIDIAEEVTRLHSHLLEIEALLNKGGELGKRLDFLIQELHREANTLGAKSPSIDLTRVSVDMKVLIEQMREQVQNLE